MRLHGSVLWPIMWYGFLFLALVRRGQFAIIEGAITAGLLSFTLSYLLNAVAHSQGMDIRRWPLDKKNSLFHTTIIIIAITVVIVISTISKFN